MLMDVEELEEEQREFEEEIAKLEAWTNTARPLLDDPNWIPSWEDKRTAIRILGITAKVYPAKDCPERIVFEVRPPKIVSLTLRSH